MKKAFFWVFSMSGAVFLGFFAAMLLLVLISGVDVEPFGERVGIVSVKGFIGDRMPAMDGLRAFMDDEDVKAIVVRVESPGGVVAPAQELHDLVKRIAVDKPVVASFGSLAASGGYYLSAPATKIVSNPGTVTGSIGAILQFHDYRVLMDKLGLRFETVKSGPHKDAGSPFREMTQEEKRIMQAMVDDIFDQFVTAVAQGREMEKDEVLKLADGRIFSGRQALELGLVDELGGLDEAVRIAGELGGLGPDPETEHYKPRPRGPLSALLGEDAAAARNMIEPMNASPLRFVLPSW